MLFHGCRVYHSYFSFPPVTFFLPQTTFVCSYHHFMEQNLFISVHYTLDMGTHQNILNELNFKWFKWMKLSFHKSNKFYLFLLMSKFCAKIYLLNDVCLLINAEKNFVLCARKLPGHVKKAWARSVESRSF